MLSAEKPGMEEKKILEPTNSSDLSHTSTSILNEPLAQQTVEQTLISAEWAGPLPPPIILKDFNEIIPNGADRIMSMIEKEQESRIDFQNNLLQAQVTDRNKTLWLAFIIALVSIAATILSLYLKAHPVVSFALASTTPISIVRTIFARRRKKEKNDITK